MTTVYIYKLVDPRNGEVKYVGKTNKPANRRKQHRAVLRHYCTAKWKAELLALGLYPSMEILEETDDFHWHEREQHWIERLRTEGAALLNIATTPISGPRPGYVMSEATKEKIRQAHKGRKRVINPAWQAVINARIGQPIKNKSPESITKFKATILAKYGKIGFYGEHHRKANSEAKKRDMKAYWTNLTPAQRQIRQSRFKPPSASAETRAKLSAATKVNMAKLSLEQRKARGIAGASALIKSGLFQSDEYRAKMSASVKAHWDSLTPEQRKIRTEATLIGRGHWVPPTFIENSP